MEIILILLALSNVFLIIVSFSLGFLVYNAMKSNFALQDIVDSYYGFLEDVNFIINNDVDFLRSELAKKLSLNIPEVRELNHALSKLQNNLQIVKVTVAKFKEGQK